MGVLHHIATELASENRDFRFQRRLMDGGTCEATAFCAAGYRAGGLALPLGNYHNMQGLDGGPAGIGAEHILVSDYVSEIELLVRLAESSARLPKLEKATEEWIEPLTDRAHEMLTAEPLLPARRAR
jgi:endoglucanase